MSVKTQYWARRLHRFVAYLVGLQLAIWVGGGLVFAWVPFDSVVKSGDVVVAPSAQFNSQGWSHRLMAVEATFPHISSLQTVASAQGELLRFEAEGSQHWISLRDGRIDARVSEEQIGDFAKTLYVGDGQLVDVTYLNNTELRFAGLVDELYGRTQVWRASFDDEYGTRLYFDDPVGRYLTARNDYWVIYDAMWRLHIMDYRGGKDFNNWLLIIFASLSGIFVVSGLVLSYLALRRLVRGFFRRG